MKKQTIVMLSILAGMLAGIGTRIASAADGVPPVQIHGYMQNRFYQNSGANTQFRSERISVTATAALSEESTAYVELYYHPWAGNSGIYVESAYYDTPLGPGHIRVGKGRRLTFGITPYWSNRRTSNYGLVAEAITQDRIQGVQYYVQRGNIDSGISVHTNYRLGTRPIGDLPGDALHTANNTIPHLSLRDVPGALGDNLQFSGRLGGRWLDGPNGLKLGMSGSIANVDPADLAALTAAATATAPAGPLFGVANPKKQMLQYGPDFTYRFPNGFLVQSEAYWAEASNLRYFAGNILGGWESPGGWKAFVRYGVQDMFTPATANPLTWDTKQLSISVVQPIRKGVWLQYEYEKNAELTNGPKVKNDVFFAELFTGF